MAIIGRNGSGKSTLLKAITGMLRPVDGSIIVNGRVIYLAGVNPGFDPELSGRENVKQLAFAYGIGSEVVTEFVEKIRDFTELGEAFERKYGGYSSGMMGKLGFGFISELRSDILIIDETFGAGDREFKKKAKSKMDELIHETATVVMATHSMELAKRICDRCIVIDDGILDFDGRVEHGVEHYKTLTENTLNWIQLPYEKKFVSSGKLSFDFDEEFGCREDLRFVIFDNSSNSFTTIKEIDGGENFEILIDELPTELDCKFKLQQFRDGKWYDASKYVQISVGE